MEWRLDAENGRFRKRHEWPHAGDLKTQATWWETHRRSLKAAVEWLREHWLIGALIALLGVTGACYRAWAWIAELMERS